MRGGKGNAFARADHAAARRRAAPSVVRPPADTLRLRFRELAPDDLDFAAAMLGDPEVMRFYPRPLGRAEAAAWIGRQLARYRSDGHGLWRVALRDVGEPVGQIGLSRQLVDGREELEVGYLLHRPFWGRGLASEAAAACRDHAFQATRAGRVVSLIRPENHPSRAVAERLGMRPGRRVRFGGYTHLVYGISRRRWQAVRSDPPRPGARG